MNLTNTLHATASREALESRFAHRITACLSESAQSAPADVSERLRFARQKALEAAQRSRNDESVQGLGVSASGTATLGLSRSRWWLRIASVLPLVALVGGLVLIQEGQTRTQISVAAEVDEALLGDDLPINAYRDPGFTEFLKAPTDE